MKLASIADEKSAFHEEPVSAPVRVFLVEDSAAIRESLSQGISSPGRIEVVGYAETEDAARRSLSRLNCDIVVLDIELKQGNGLNVLAWLRAQPSGASSTYPPGAEV